MIYLFHGSDVGRARAKAFAWVTAARLKAPDAAYVRLEGDEITEAALRDAISSQGLFFSKSLVLLDDPFRTKESAEVVSRLRDELVSSENPIGILAPKLAAAQLRDLEPVAAKVFREDAAAKPARGFNSALVNALGNRDGKTLWKEILKALRAGDVPETVHGLLHWKARDLMQKGSPRWSKEEARELSVSLIELVAGARSGDLPLSQSLERFALSLR
ncbi:MAG TPA: hypothetical protein VNU25_00895 [Candidatus Paceibacterota bacterium]|nr:hypothetical protein [Candidatus Paceibacterota bacterium]